MRKWNEQVTLKVKVKWGSEMRKWNEEVKWESHLESESEMRKWKWNEKVTLKVKVKWESHLESESEMPKSPWTWNRAMAAPPLSTQPQSSNSSPPIWFPRYGKPLLKRIMFFYEREKYQKREWVGWVGQTVFHISYSEILQLKWPIYKIDKPTIFQRPSYCVFFLEFIGSIWIFDGCGDNLRCFVVFWFCREIYDKKSE